MSAIETRATEIPTGTWKVDPSHSRVEFSIRHMGIASIRGSFADFDAVIDGGEEPRISGAIRVGSVDTRDEARDGHLQSPDFFDAERHPEIEFRTDGLSVTEDGTVAGPGELTIKGVTRPVELKGRVASAQSVDPFGRERLGLTLETAIDRNEFGISWNAPNQSGGNYLGDDVTLKAELTFVRQAS